MNRVKITPPYNHKILLDVLHNEFTVSPNEILGTSRARHIVFPRQLFSYILKDIHGSAISDKIIADFFLKIDRSSINTHIRSIREACEIYEDTKKIVDKLSYLYRKELVKEYANRYGVKIYIQ